MGKRDWRRSEKKSRKKRKALDNLMRVCYCMARKIEMAQENLSEKTTDNYLLVV